MSIQRKFPAAVAACLLGSGLFLHTAPALADGAGAFLGGMLAGRVLRNMSDRTRAEEYSAYSQPRTVVVHQSSHSSAGSAEGRIKQLDKLAAGGYITPQEYKQKKQKIIDDM